MLNFCRSEDETAATGSGDPITVSRYSFSPVDIEADLGSTIVRTRSFVSPPCLQMACGAPSRALHDSHLVATCVRNRLGLHQHEASWAAYGSGLGSLAPHPILTLR
jgi:hypothetical protein